MMVRKEFALKKLRSFQKSGSFKLKKMLEIPGRLSHSMILDRGNGKETMEEKAHFLGQAENSSALDDQEIGSVYNDVVDRLPVSRLSKNVKGPEKDKHPSDMEIMKERFAKLLLGEDMSGRGEGVSSALALSNAITNLAASVFGDQSKLEPVSAEGKARWKKEVDWLLLVTDYIVEFTPSQQTSKDGTTMEIMVTQQRRDLLMNIPALRKLDAMLISCLDSFTDNEFWYVSKDADDSEKGVQMMDKRCLPTVKVPPDGLSEESRRKLQYQKECVNQVLKASLAINAQILSEMEIPDNYIENLPKNGRESLGESIYKNITVDIFVPEQFLSTMDLSSDHAILDLKDRIEASIIIWKRKLNPKEMKSSWGSAISLEKRELFEERAETILLLLKLRFPDIPQSSLDISKIQFNKDVGHSILESYSRVLESLANTVMTCIEDVLYADSLTKWKPSPNSSPSHHPSSLLVSDAEPPLTRTSLTMFDFIGLHLDNMETQKKLCRSEIKRFSYITKIENCPRSPTARH
ncbi:guanyl-nucleotide exchange factor [Lithospermum erythrorhizon]|uniref:Guanyl-nucleotide exchange factor n=1 Tax=Lithospermum erythrorhizon TaxID=34254 RepID=A0AAV3QR49_LITER